MDEECRGLPIGDYTIKDEYLRRMKIERGTTERRRWGRTAMCRHEGSPAWRKYQAPLTPQAASCRDQHRMTWGPFKGP
jgi:hypothetical protein